MIAHTGLLVSDYQKSKEFYVKVLGTLGYTNNMPMDEHKASGFNDGKDTDFWISETKEKVTPTHIAFGAKNKEEVEAFYKVALEVGAKDNGAPGYRKEYWPGYYAAFVYDLDGHNVEVVWYDYDQVKD
jgi:predicted lactoylglutathione lyase